MTTKTIYLDYNATCPLIPEIWDDVAAVMRAPYNASSIHGLGRKGHHMLEGARRAIAELTNSDSKNIVFNSGATEGNNTVLKHFSGAPVLVGATEHPSVLEAREDAHSIPACLDGTIDLNALEDLLKTIRPKLVSVMYANNESGVINPVQKISGLCKKYGAFYHCDGVQALGREAVDIFELGIDFLTISGHKIGGPQGSGALIMGMCGETPTLLHGGGQEKKARAGTQNLASIHGFGLAARYCQENMNTATQTLRGLRDHLEAKILEICPECVIHGKSAQRLCNTNFFSVPGLSSQTMLMGLDLENIAASNGSACSSGSTKTSHVLKAMNVADDLAGAAVRISLGHQTNQEDVDHFLDVFTAIYKRARR